MRAYRRSMRPPRRGIVALAAAVAAAATLLLGVLTRRPGFDVFDDAWMRAMLAVRTPVLEAAARVLDVLGSNVVAVALLPLAGAVALLLRRRPWAAAVVVVAPAVGASLTRELKRAVGRERPAENLLDLSSAAFPSGHVENAAVLAVLATVLVARWWVAVVGTLAVLLMALSRTLLGAHWLTDTVGGALLGAAVGFVAWAVLAPRLRAERVAPRPRAGSAASVDP